MFVVAPSAAAAEVLAVDTGVAADTLDKLLVEHRLDRPPDHRFDLPAGSTWSTPSAPSNSAASTGSRTPGNASLRLRRGDVSVVELYEEHGRLHGGTAMRMRGAIVRA